MTRAHHHHAHDHHAHARSSDRPALPASLLRLSVPVRLALVLPLIVLLWAAALWVIGGSVS